MHSRAVSEQWNDLESRARSPIWRLVDLLITVRSAFTRVVPARLLRVMALVPGLILAGSLVAGLAVLLVRSLHTYDSFLAVEGPLSVEQYTGLIGDSQFHTVLARTVTMALIAPLVAVAIAIPYALTLTQVRRRGLRLALLIGVFVPMLTGDITRTFGLLVTIGPSGPLEWLTGLHLVGSLWGVGIGIVQTLLPAAVVVLLPAVLRIDPELAAAAATLGAPPFTAFRRVTLPQLRPGIVAALAACFALTMAAFADPAILGRGLKNFVSNFLQDRYLGLGNPPAGAAIGIAMLLIVSLGTALILTLNRRRR
ncbi:ABC transporter permease subunit [Mycobacterium yunnanensis]|uniref:ABC transporter permease subunit n=1 Tax=Mycobacterium yunnanensis TaxID=368477 RepID=A0A9X2ZAK9_9MYCO|nr:ABC transporter permease subunit [Mycobacterium yunnanensis]MCV7424515.1 ABC transporter permease subunit [Mycobacterium yunnanensis]